MYQDITLEITNRIALISINRTQVSNAFAKTTYGEIRDAVAACEGNEDVGCIVITGNGKNFSAGGDIKRFKELIDSKEYLSEESISSAAEMGAAIRRCAKPVIAMVNGAASGAGLSLALACDFRTGTPKTKLTMAFIKMGLSGDTGSIYFLMKLLNAGKASEMVMTGRPVGGEEAYNIGLLNVLAPEDGLMEATMKFASGLANAPLFAIRKQKELINKFFYADLPDYTVDETKAMAACSRTDDFAEAVNAFLEKRAPHFQGK